MRRRSSLVSAVVWAWVLFEALPVLVALVILAVLVYLGAPHN